MSSVHIYQRVRGLKIEKFLALRPGVQGALSVQAAKMAMEAKSTLARHRDEGHSRINITKGKRTDWYVNLDDTRGQRAAWAIENGTYRSRGVSALAKSSLKARVFV